MADKTIPTTNDPLKNISPSTDTSGEENQPEKKILSDKEKQALTQEILENETKFHPQSEQFKKIEAQVKKSLQKQETNIALRDLTL